MIVLITGGSGSGKSEYAEQRVLSLGNCVRCYAATMEAFGEEGRRRVLRHRRLREGKGFLTIERQRDIGSMPLPEGVPCAVLVECISNLAANEMFAGEEPACFASLADRIEEGVRTLSRRVRHLVLVTNEIFSDGICYEKETMEYIRLMGELNRRLAALADEVVEVVYGIPLVRKQYQG